MVLEKKSIHFVGIGGIGMSSIALVLLKMGHEVSGSDLEPNSLTEKLKKMGAKIFKGHARSNIGPDVQVLIYSSSINNTNSEIAEAKMRGIPIMKRAQALGELLNKKKGIAVTGTHGKTTTTSLISVMLEKCGLDPTVMIGGEVPIFGSNAKYGNGDYVVAEADESDGSFLHLKPFYSVIMNIEMEHVDYYRTLEDAVDAYKAFANNTKRTGALFFNNDDQNIKKMLKDFKGRSESFSLHKGADIYPYEIKMNESRSSYLCVYRNEVVGKVFLNIPGKHNILNSLAAIQVGLNIGLSFDKITQAVQDFTGTKRRFHIRADSDGIMLIDDYAHHPTEIRAVLEACNNWKNRRLIVIFQPHRYSRTKFLADEFGSCFKGAHKLILTDIYAASEEPIEGISSTIIYDRVKIHGPDDVVILTKEEITNHVMKLKKSGDMILVLGAGDIKDVANELSEKLNKR